MDLGCLKSFRKRAN